MLVFTGFLTAITNVRATDPHFTDQTVALALTLTGEKAAWCDINADGWPDLLCGGRLFLNRNGQSFDAVDTPGVGAGLVVDLDNDGDGDVISYSPLAILRNLGFDERGLPHFEPVALPELPEILSRGAAAGDFNGDGFLDVYIGGFEVWETQRTFPDLLLLGDGRCGVMLAKVFPDYRARGVTACDFDADGDLDIYDSNYRLQPNVLWINDGHGQIVDDAPQRNAVATSPGFEGGHSIGACWGDFDGDGLFDLFAGNFAHVDDRGDQPKSRFLHNLGPDRWVFDDLHESGVWYQESYASPACADFDNDGHLDLYFTTVYPIASFGKENHAVLYRQREPWKFLDVTQGSGLDAMPPTYQAAWADYDRDGRVDLVTGGRLYRNETPDSGHWLEVRVIGDRSSPGGPDAIGAQVRVALDDGRCVLGQVEAGTGEGNSNSPVLHFGLGSWSIDRRIDVAVRWPGSAVWQAADSAFADRLITLTRPSLESPDNNPAK